VPYHLIVDEVIKYNQFKLFDNVTILQHPVTADGCFRQLPDHHGYAFTDADGLSGCPHVAVDEVWAGAGDREGDGSLQDHAGVLR
jgi:hypothetical protein